MALVQSFRSSVSPELSDNNFSLESIPDGTTMDYSDDRKLAPSHLPPIEAPMADPFPI